MIHGPWIADALTQRLTGQTVKALAVTSTHVDGPDYAFRSEIVNEITGSGYVAGGVVVTGVAASYDATSDTVKVDCNDVDFGAVTAPDVGGVVFYIDTGNAATDPVLWTDTFAAVAADGTLSYTVDPTGAMAISMVAT